jgi:PAS domain S-box-containing protein
MENKKARILAIDDNKDNLIVLKALIKESFPDAVYLSAESGIKGYELCQIENPDVILLDIVMPGMDGYEVCSKIKNNIKTKHIPVVMVTANRTDRESRLKALEAGADAFLPKPIDESELTAQIRAMLRIKESEDRKIAEKVRLEDMVLDRTEALELELADRKKAEEKLILSLDKLNRNRKAITNLMSDLRNEMAERKIIENNLQSERNLLRTLIDNLPDTIYILDKEGRKVIANKEDLWNIGCKSEQEVLGKTDIELFPGEIGVRGHTDNMTVINTETPLIDHEEYFIIDGKKHWLVTSKYPLYDSDGKIKGLLGTGHDITRRKEIEEDIKQKNKELTFLNKLATDLSAFETVDNIPVFMHNRLKEYTGSEFLIYSEFDSDKRIFITRHINSEKPVLSKLMKVAGDKILNKPAPLNITDESLNEMITEVVSLKKSLNDASFGAIPKVIDKAFGSFTGIDRYIGLSYVVSGEIYGTTLFGLKQSQSTPSMELLKSFANIIAVSLQRRRAEDTLKISEEKFRVLIHNQGEGVGVVDLNEIFIFANPAAEEMFGVKPGQLLNRSLLDFIPELQRPIVKRESEKRAKEEKSTYEVDIIRPGGEKRTVLITATPQYNKDRKLTGTFGVFRDITERKIMEQKIIESEAYYRTLIDISPDGIIIADLEGNVSYGSFKALEIFGIPPDGKVIGTSVLKWVAPDYQLTVMERISEIIRGNISPETREYKLMKFDGSIFWGELSSSPLIDTNGSPAAIMMVCRDISFRKQAEEELIKAKDKAEESDRLKTAFLHNISHEIRTPMNAIIGFSSMLGDPQLDKESQKSFVDTITQSSNHLLSIVTDIIEISNIEAGLIKPSTSIICVNDVMRDLHKIYLQKISEKGIEFKISTLLTDREARISTDSAKINQVLSSMLSNAIKFTSAGQIVMGYTRLGNYLEFYVKDTGIGIPADQQERIFDRFYQVENSISRQYEGTGLGLSISKAFVELLGGKIWLTSNPGSGSTFFFTIPYNNIVEIPETLIIPVERLGSDHERVRTILIAEDEDNNFRLMKVLLSHLNLNILRAENGKEAVDICESEAAIDLIIMDIKMPVMDGYEATARIKKIRPGLIVIAQTAFAFEADREKAIKAGCDDYLPKPVKKDVFIAMIRKYL